jgi:hypothetical protein
MHITLIPSVYNESMASNGGRDRIDMDRLNAFLEAKGADTECPVCGALDWTTASALGVVPVSEGTEPLIQTDKGIPVVSMFCDNCGFVRLHNAKPIFEG